jgi:V/A-type H+/Na+-transporting ATPase subunit C
MINLSENPEYGFANGRVRSLETTLLDRSRYDRLVRSGTLPEFLQALADTPYGKYPAEGGAVDFDAALAAAGRDNFAFLAEYAFDPWLLTVFRLPGQILELKRALKRTLIAGGEPVRPAAEPGSRLDAAIASALAEYAEKHDPALMDMALDRAQQELLVEAARPSAFLSGFYSLHADLVNLRSLLRVKVMGDERSVFDAAFLPGGTIAKGMLTLLLVEPTEALVTRFAATPFHSYVEEGVNQAVHRKTMTRMERLGREAELSYLRQSRYATFGHEPLVTYFLLRENELRNLRGLYAAHAAGLSETAAHELVAWVE